MNNDEESLARWLGDDLSEEERREFAKRLEADLALRNKLGRHLEIDAMLSVELESGFSKERALAGILGTLPDDEADAFFEGVERKIHRQSFRPWWLGAAAAVAILMVAGVLMTRPSAVATVTAVRAPGAVPGIGAGLEIRKGGSLEFGAGLVEVALKGGGAITVEGPAKLRWSGDQELRLERGRLRMRGAGTKGGYQIHTSGGTVREVGGDVGVIVNAGRTEVHHFEGQVQASMMGQPVRTLGRNEALSSGGDRPETFLAADDGAFYSGLPPATGAFPKMIHWGMDLGAGGMVRADSGDFGKGNFDLVTMPGAAPGRPQAAEGKYGGAVAFDGRGAFMESAFPGIAGRAARTVCFWVKVPADLKPEESFAMISWGRFGANDLGSVWQVSINPHEADGAVGRLRVGAHGGSAVGSSDLRDGRWHHAAVVLYPANGRDAGHHVLLYIDGVADAISNRTLKDLWTDVDADHGVWLGRDVTDTANPAGTAAGRFFRGTLDEVTIFGGALSQQQVIQVMNGQLPAMRR